jgi:hypothetical protein
MSSTGDRPWCENETGVKKTGVKKRNPVLRADAKHGAKGAGSKGG